MTNMHSRMTLLLFLLTISVWKLNANGHCLLDMAVVESIYEKVQKPVVIVNLTDAAADDNLVFQNVENRIATIVSKV